jgi:hypothetical protein
MDSLIRLLGEWLARRIETGSRLGALLGAMLGLAASAAAVAALNAEGLLDAYRYAGYVMFGVPATLVGAVVGARVGPAHRPADPGGGVRLTNYNRAAAPLVVALAMTGILVAMLVAPDTGKPGKPAEPLTVGEQVALYAGFPLVLVAALAWAFTIVWSVDLGSVITVRRLLRTRQYNLNALQDWSFSADGRPAGRQPFGGPGELNMLFGDGKRFAVPLDGSRSAAVAQAMALATRGPGR